MVLVRDVCMGDLAALGRALRPGAAAARLLRRRGPGDRRRRPVALGLVSRSWLALRRGDLGAPMQTHGRHSPRPSFRHHRFTVVLEGGVLLVKMLVDQGELEAAEEVLEPLDSEARAGFAPEHSPSVSAEAGFGSNRVGRGRARGLPGRRRLLTRAMITCPSYLPWRSEAALAQLALGDPEAARRARRRGARARPGVRRPARARRRETRRRPRGRRRAWRAPAA